MELLNVYNKYNINIVSGKNHLLYDQFNNCYLDMYGGHGVISIGHSNNYYIEKLTSQLKKIGFYSNIVENKLQEELANKLGEISGYTNYNLFLCNSGSEANENALKLASFFTHKEKVISFRNSFHGRTSGSLTVTDNPRISSKFNINSKCTFLDFNSTKNLENLLKSDTYAAVIVEGIQGVGGVHLPENQFLKSIRELCTKYNTLMIVDEVQSGFGRTGKFFAHQYFNIQPDIITMAKGMGNGFPIAGLIVAPNIKTQFGMLGTTFGGNHLACAASISVIDILKNDNLLNNATQIGNYLLKELKLNPKIKKCRGKGLMIGIDIENRDVIKKKLLFKHKIFTGASGKDTLRFLPPLNIDQQSAEQLINALNIEL